jgi:RimJ/RimL family protein N-acetyltransferase
VTPTPTVVRAWIDEGRFDLPDAAGHWIEVDGERAGLVVLRELGDMTPTFDLRLRAAFRGRGLGRAALRWLAEHVFATSDKPRLEGHTRADNLAMRAAFRAAGWVQEAHYRRAWPDEARRLHDAVAYAILRDDWASGTTTPVPWDGG